MIGAADKSIAERKAQSLALVITAALVFLLAWGAVSLLLMGSPEAVIPAESTLTVNALDRTNLASEEYDSVSLAARPVFWAGRQPYIQPDNVPIEEEDDGIVVQSLDGVKLLGVYSGGSYEGVIVATKQTKQRLKLNESILGWEFTGLSESGAKFSNGPETRVIPLEPASRVTNTVPRARPGRAQSSAGNRSRLPTPNK